MTSTGEMVIRKDDYLVGPTYAHSLLVGQGVDALSMGGLSLSTGATEYEDCDDDDEEMRNTIDGVDRFDASPHSSSLRVACRCVYWHSMSSGGRRHWN